MQELDSDICELNRWASNGAALIHTEIQKCLLVNARCSVMLTGGRSAKELYTALSRLLNHSQFLNRIDFYFGDERCVPADSPDSNYRMVMTSLFPEGVPNKCKIYAMNGESSDLREEANRYAALLPDVINILLLSVGEDGHIASLFPGSNFLKDSDQLVKPVVCTKFPYERLTITLPVIRRAQNIFVLAQGKIKEKFFFNLRSNPENYIDMPAKLVLKANWLLDNETVIFSNKIK